MTKLKIALLVKEKTGLTRRQSIDIVEYFLTIIKNTVKAHEPVRIMKFGSFYIKDKKPRRSRNPKTGEQVFVQAKKVVSFKAGKGLVDLVNAQ